MSTIPISEAIAAFRGTSFSPEDRGRQAIETLEGTLSSDYDRFEDCREELREEFEQEFARYRLGLVARYREWLRARGRLLSPMITGPSGFPTARNRKAGDSERNKWAAMMEYRKKALDRLEKTVHPERRPVMSGDDDAVERLEEKIQNAQANQDAMKQANAIIRGKGTSEEKIGRLCAVLGVTRDTVEEIMKPDYMGRVGFAPFELQNNNANIRRMKQRLEYLKEAKTCNPSKIAGRDGVTIEDDPAANRIRLYFPGKPDAETRQDLKRNGFRWARSIGAWQAYRNTRSMQKAEEFRGDAAPEEGTADDDPYAAMGM